MTISSTNRVAGPFVGAGSTATFPFTFKVFSAEDLLAVQLDVATGAMTTLALTADYSAVLNEDQDSSPGGSITLEAGNLAAGLTLTITTDMAQLQGVDLTNGGAFYPDVLNGSLDTLTILIQQLQALLALTIQAPLVDGAPDLSLPSAALRAGKLLAFDANGNLSLMTVAAGGVVPGAQVAGGAVDGTNRTFTFTASAAASPAPLVFAGGVFLNSVTDYPPPTLVSGTTWQVVLNAAPTQGPIVILQLA